MTKARRQFPQYGDKARVSFVYKAFTQGSPDPVMSSWVPKKIIEAPFFESGPND